MKIWQKLTICLKRIIAITIIFWYDVISEIRHMKTVALIKRGFLKEFFTMMIRDIMTGLPGMSLFFMLAQTGRKKLQDAGEQSAVLFIDLNGMKYFNLKYGFAEGDKLLVALAKILANYFGEENCSRFGQDHFAVYTKADGLEETLRKLFDDCKKMNGGRTLPVKVGIYLDSMGFVETSLACDRAKFACNKKRDDYRSYFTYFDESMLEKDLKRRYVLDNLDRALQENWITAYYQPIIRAANDKVCDEEALVRWIDPEKGMLSPADFIPVLEDSKLIYKVDIRMVELVLEKMRRQVEAGLFLVPISVNLSRNDFEACDIVEEIRQRVDASGLGRDKLVIEITESVIGQDFDYMKSQIERFRGLGFKVWMDDFGSGYSSLNILQDVKFDVIKFDMRFMQEFENGDKGEKSKMILAELIKMAMALGVETVTEGVETEQQMQFLCEIGCMKLQGYYYTKPIPMEKILERYQKGIQIGFENPKESAYYESLGRINLYDLSVVASEDEFSFQHYFDTIPMAVIETDGTWMCVSRCNKSYRDFMKRYFGFSEVGKKSRHQFRQKGEFGTVFMNAICQCREDGKKAFFNEYAADGYDIHAFIRRIALNPVTGVAACAVAVLAIIDESGQGISYAHVARALSADYQNLYYVNLETERFVEYSPDAEKADLAVEQRGMDFFNVSRRDALSAVYEDDREKFLISFTKENMVKALRENGTFTLTYRLMINGKPTYMNMKAVPMHADGKQVVIGVNNVDAQMRQQENMDRIRDERTTFERISALVGNFLCIYTVNPIDDHYLEYSSIKEYEQFGLSHEGDDFFGQTVRQAKGRVYDEDLELFCREFQKENIFQQIGAKGVYKMDYRLVLSGAVTDVCLRAGMVEEKGGAQLIVGITLRD